MGLVGIGIGVEVKIGVSIKRGFGPRKGFQEGLSGGSRVLKEEGRRGSHWVRGWSQGGGCRRGVLGWVSEGISGV